MKKVIAGLLTIVLLIPFSSKAQISKYELYDYFYGYSISKQKSIKTQITGSHSDFITISTDSVQVLLLKDDYGDYASDNHPQKKKNKSKKEQSTENGKTVLYIPYSEIKSWDNSLDYNYQPKINITLKTAGLPLLGKLEKGIEFADFYYGDSYSYSCYEKGIFGELLYDDGNESNLNSDDDWGNWEDVIEDDNNSVFTFDIDRMIQEGYLLFELSNVTYNDLNNIDIEIHLEPTTLSPEQAKALVEIRDYCNKLDNWNTENSSQELFSILDTMRELRLRDSIDLTKNYRFLTTRVEQEVKIVDHIDSLAQTGDERAMLWAARIGCVCGDIFTAIKYYVMLASQGNSVAANEIQLCSVKSIGDTDWSMVASYFNGFKEIGLMTEENYSQIIQYIKNEIIGKGMYNKTIGK